MLLLADADDGDSAELAPQPVAAAASQINPAKIHPPGFTGKELFVLGRLLITGGQSSKSP